MTEPDSRKVEVWIPHESQVDTDPGDEDDEDEDGEDGELDPEHLEKMRRRHRDKMQRPVADK